MHSTENERLDAGRNTAGQPGRDGRSTHPFHGARFLTTAAEWRQLPSGGVPEVAFAGRSNAGKSAAINALVAHSGLAFVSRTPGRTQHINFFQLQSGALLADLPGYGYAAVPAATRRHWQTFLARYLSTRVPLVGLVLMMDVRHPLTPLDRRMLDWFLPAGRPVRILLTKADKYSASERALALSRASGILAHHYAAWDGQIAAQLFSATRRLGIAEAEAAIYGWLERAGYPGATKRKAPASRGVTRGRKRPAIGENSQP